MFRPFGWVGAWAWVGLCSTWLGCGLFSSDSDSCADNPVLCYDGGSFSTGHLGESCDGPAECSGPIRLGCIDGKCGFLSNLGEGDPCTVTLECASDLYCSVEDGRHRCAKAGTSQKGARCESTAECQRNLVCAYDQGLSKHCLPAGTGDLGTACKSTSECLAGLSCVPPEKDAQPVCLALEPGQVPFVPWEGVACKDDEKPLAYFDVPRSPDGDGDFFRLPFPNDVRKTDEGLDLSGFPSPGDLFGLGFDLVGSYVKAAEKLDGFATNPVVYFRFSRAYRGVNEDSVLLFDIDEDSPNYGRALSRSWGTSVGDITSYVCRNWLNVRTPLGSPLRGNTTYAVILTNGIKPSAGGSFARSSDLSALLGTSVPEDAKLRAAHAAYAPLRAFLSDPANAGKVKAADVLNAAVFTTQDPAGALAKTRSAIREDDPPRAIDLTVCKNGVESPCDDGGERACGKENADYVEVHGRIRLPIFQSGTAPYVMSGGGFVVDGSGRPKVQRSENVCFALALPKDPPPESGYPLVIYAHGTGGSFKSGIRELASSASKAGGAVLAIDLPQHGERANGSELSPEELFYNFVNAPAARDNVTQGAADLMSLVYWATTVDEDEGSAFGQRVLFDAARIALFGHSQGATHASIAAPFEPDVGGVILSGVGGDLSEALVSKRSPIDIATSLYLILGDRAAAPDGELCPAEIDPTTGEPKVDGEGNVRRYKCIGTQHPVYALMQTFFERADPVNFGALLTKPTDDAFGKHVFMTFGIADTYAPDGTQKAYVLSSGLVQVGPEVTRIRSSVPALEPPLSLNAKVGDVTFTQGVRQYEPASGEDGHFVYLGPAKADVQRFLRALLLGEDPAIGE